MFRLFNAFSRREPVREYRLPPGLRVYAVGDVHGRADLLRQLHATLVRDAADIPEAPVAAIYLGDYLDRGPQVRETLDELAHGLPDRFRTAYLRGNHEYLFLEFLKNPIVLEGWLAIGAAATLLSYGVQPPGSGFSAEQAATVRDDMIVAMPEEHLRFLRLLKPSLRIGDYLFAHAGVRPGVDPELQKEADLLWVRREFMDSKQDHGVRVVHGHTILDHPEVRPNRISLDTGAYATGVLTCAVLEEDRVRFLDTGGEGRLKDEG